jgi:hypothetical protein
MIFIGPLKGHDFTVFLGYLLLEIMFKNRQTDYVFICDNASIHHGSQNNREIFWKYNI